LVVARGLLITVGTNGVGRTVGAARGVARGNIIDGDVRITVVALVFSIFLFECH
jgi:hypothetical protein